MSQFQIHEGSVAVRSGSQIYVDTIANFAIDFGQTPPPIPSNIVTLLYDDQVPLFIVNDGVSQSDASQVFPLAFAKNAIVAVAAILQAQKVRLTPPPPVPPPAPPPLSPLAQALSTVSQMLAKGLTITSVSAPSLNGVYGTSAQDIVNVTALQTAINTNASLFPGRYHLASFQPVKMTAEQFTVLAEAILGFVSGMDDQIEEVVIGNSPNWPSASVTVP